MVLIVAVSLPVYFYRLEPLKQMYSRLFSELEKHEGLKN